MSVDGTKVDANASKHRSVRYDRAKELVEQLRADIDELMSKAEQADRVRSSVAAQLARREKLAEQLISAWRAKPRHVRVNAVSDGEARKGR